MYTRMIRTYSKRLLSPFVGLVQVAELPLARALSRDGRNWVIQYSLVEEERFRNILVDVAPAGAEYALVGLIKEGELDTRGLHPALNTAPVKAAIKQLYEMILHASVPFAAVDRYQYWLLDREDGLPLALLHSCIREQEMERYQQPRPEWMAIPAAQLDVPDPEREQAEYVPPVNYRLERLIGERAGINPRGAWFERREGDADEFPPCLIREDWETGSEQQLCDRYISRLAPRLLMLQELPHPVRQRLEVAAREHVFDVERYHTLYPEVIDRELLTAARVEARLRRTTED